MWCDIVAPGQKKKSVGFVFDLPHRDHCFCKIWYPISLPFLVIFLKWSGICKERHCLKASGREKLVSSQSRRLWCGCQNRWGFEHLNIEQAHITAGSFAPSPTATPRSSKLIWATCFYLRFWLCTAPLFISIHIAHLQKIIISHNAIRKEGSLHFTVICLLLHSSWILTRNSRFYLFSSCNHLKKSRCNKIRSFLWGKRDDERWAYVLPPAEGQ